MQTIAIISALKKELDPLYIDIANKRLEAKVKDVTFYSGNIKEIAGRIIFGSFGVGKVLAALSTQFIIDTFKPESVYLIGACGGATKGIRFGDVIVGESTIQADFDISCFGFAKGEFQMDSEDKSYKEFRTDLKLIDWIKEKHKLQLLPVNRKQPKIMKSRIISQDRFETNKEVFKSLQDEFNYLGIDMESAAVNVVCNFNNVSFNVIKSVLDKEGLFDINLYNKYFPIVCTNSYLLLKKYLISKKI